MNTEPWVTAEHVAEHLGVAKDTVYRWREQKGLPAHRVGRLWKFQLSEVDEWVRTGGPHEAPLPSHEIVLKINKRRTDRPRSLLDEIKNEHAGN